MKRGLEIVDQLRHPACSSGYLGAKIKHSSLSNQFFGDLLAGPGLIDIEKLMVFPQRVPVTGFFDELKENEIPQFSEAFGNVQRDYLSQINGLLSSRNLEAGLFRACNLIDICARLGLLAEIDDLTQELELVETTEADLFFLKVETYRILHSHSKGEPVQVERLFARAVKAKDQLIKSLMFARVIVSGSRYKTGTPGEISPQHIKEIEEFLFEFNPSTMLESIWLSMIFRAIPMLPNTSTEKANDLMQRSLRVVNAIKPDGFREELVKKELLLTTLQSVAKMHFARKENGYGEESLYKMIDIDRYDSVGFSELALYYFKQDRFNEALKYFLSAIELGPPSYAMNTYFAAKCFEKLGQDDSAIEQYHAVTLRDRFAVSPYLDLVQLFMRRNHHSRARELANHVLVNPDLAEQLEDTEFRWLKDV